MWVELIRASRRVCGSRRRLFRSRRAGCYAMAAVVSCGVLVCRAQSTTTESPDKPRGTILLPAVNRPPDANDRMEMQEKQQRKVNFDAANTARLRQMAEDSDALLTMAMALKAEIDNSPSGKLSANAQRKAEVIERLAKGVKEKMKLTVAPN